MLINHDDINSHQQEIMTILIWKDGQSEIGLQNLNSLGFYSEKTEVEELLKCVSIDEIDQDIYHNESEIVKS